MCPPRSARSWRCCVPTHPLFSPMPRRGAAGTKNGSRCRPHAWTCAICPSRHGHAATAAPRNSPPGAGSAVRPRRLGWRPRHLALLAALARVLDHLLALGGARLVPLLAQHLALRRRQLLELVKILPHPGLLIRRQFLESLPAAAQRMALLGRQPLPVRKSLARLVTLLGRHAEPAVGAVCERLLARGRQAVPLACESRQHLALLGRKARPGDRSRGSGTRRRRLLRNGGRLLRNGGRLLCKRGRCRKQQQGDARARGVTHYFSLPLRSAAAEEAELRGAADP